MTDQNTIPSHRPADNTVLGILAYLGPLVIISYVAGKDNPFVKFHIKQGLVLLIIQVIIWFLGSWLWRLGTLLNLVNLAVFVLAIVGIVNVVKAKEDKLPIVGEWAKYFNF